MESKLKDKMILATWESLEPHWQRDALILVDQTLKLEAVGAQIALDNSSQVNTWIQSGMLTKPDGCQIKTWSQDPNLSFTALIVQPYVLVQEHKEDQIQ